MSIAQAVLEPRVVVLGTTTLAGVGASISTLEWLRNARQLAPGGLYDWAIVGSRRFAVGTRLRARVANRLLEYRGFLAVLGIRFLSVLLLPAAVLAGTRVAIVAVLAVVVGTTLLMNLRTVYGMDGSDQMTTQVYGALLLGYLPGTSLALSAALWYIAVQACFSYFVSGAAKAVSPQWRSEGVIFRIFNTQTYGYEPVARFLRNRARLTWSLGWSAFLVEMAFPLALVVGFPLVVLFVLWGVAFHVMNAVVMGLNSFLWAFAATYPAVVHVAAVLAS
ncbi:hypothetical protein SAMN06893096_102511 [Geodermatophilus pulveris]|uniref:HTTM domain-containing protein n=1 Tax=Geodermatophilus pulveris TaxID=1564159 RepID=A0A239CL97_9ACTN|nr:hypothetical protein [Geodermatophilus pulveris]SNS20880.1 hypothetical protein SAMN06893096_102511 [Geodermatophilus pulveris]